MKLSVEKLLDYTIGIAKLQNKEYSFSWKGDANFFEAFEDSLVEEGKFEVKLLLRKSEALLHLQLAIKGTLDLICDRSLEEFPYPFETEGIQILRFADHAESISDEMELIPRGAAEINIAHYIYELIALAVPMKKLHPKFRAEEKDEDLTLVYSSENQKKEAKEEDKPDPRWEELKKLIEKNK
ncbi:MAG: YceD family protein [Raineya sp.]